MDINIYIQICIYILIKVYIFIYICTHIHLYMYIHTHTTHSNPVVCVFFVFICVFFLGLYYALFPTTHFSCQPRVSRNTLPITCPQVSNCALSNTIPFLVSTYVFFLLLCVLFLTTHFSCCTASLQVHTAYHMPAGVKLYTEQYDAIFSTAVKGRKPDATTNQHL